MRKKGLLELQAVVAVAAHRNFRRAATDVGLSPSAVSHAVTSLEQRIGVRLFHRTTRSVSLSEAGEQFLSRVEPALGQIAAALESVNEFRDTPAGNLRLNTSEGAARLLLEPILLGFLERYPDMRLDVVTEGKLVDIVAEGFDAGVRLGDIVPQDMIAVPCGPPMRFAVVGSPEFFRRHGQPTTPEDLQRFNCIQPRHASGTLYRWEFCHPGGEGVELLRITPRGNLTLDSHALMVAAARQGAGLAWLSAPLIAGELAEGRLVEVLNEWSITYPRLSLYYPGHRLVPAGLKALVELIRERATADK